MPRTLYLAHLASHIAVEIGDIIHPPIGEAGIIRELDTRTQVIKLGVPAAQPEAVLTTSFQGVGLVWMDESYIKPRPKGEVDHGKASGC